MKGVVFLLIAIVGVTVAYPLLNEETDSSCVALERRIAANIIASERHGQTRADAVGQRLLANALANVFNGHAAAAISREKFKHVPPFFGCSMIYMYSLFDPGYLDRLWNDAGSRR